MKTKRLLIIRNSAIGDVAIAATLLRPYVKANPDVEFIMLSNGFLKPLFDFGTDNLTFVAADFKGRHRGFPGLVRLSRELRRMKPDRIADFHNVIRSRVIGNLLFTVPCNHLDKQRKAKRRLVRGDRDTVVVPTIRKYEELLLKAGLKDLGIGLPSKEYIPMKPHEPGDRSRVIGIAPFSRHRGKEWPLEYIDRVLEHFSTDPGCRFLLFGAGTKEKEQLDTLAGKFGNVESLVGKQSLARELEIIGGLDLMICTDSANLHFASFCGTPALSIWGATHPKTGFYGWRQDPGNAVQIDLGCRPCSVYGNRPCDGKGYACLNGISPETVIGRIESLLGIQQRQEKEKQ